MMQPVFIPTGQGPLFAVYFSAIKSSSQQAIIHIPAFAEEMNRARSEVSAQSRQYAVQGVSVLVLDLFGTGDSAGDFADATWAIWLENIDTAVNWLKQQGVELISLWGLRMGVLLAMDYISRSTNEFQQLIAWQPVLNGDIFVEQFLRLRVAASRLDERGKPESVAQLKQQLVEGRWVEVAGYRLNPELALPMMQIRHAGLNLSKVKEQLFPATTIV